MSDLERIVQFIPAFDKRHPDPKKDYGIGQMRVRFVLKGKAGAVQFVAGTGLYLKHVAAELWARHSEYNPFGGDGWDIGYHAYTPRWEGQTPMKDCDILGCDCYYDGTSLGASEFFPEFLEGGEKVVWKMLEERYADTFPSEAE